jgi:hypothetical protein
MKALRHELVHDRRHGGVPELSNALYERLGYRAVEDRVLLSFEPPATLHT